MNNNEKQKLDSIIIRIALILGLGFLAVEAGKNVIDISSQNSFPELRQGVIETERETNELIRKLEEINRERRSPSD